MRRLGWALLLIASAAHARIEVTFVDRPPYYRDDPIRIKVVTDNGYGVSTPDAQNATVERESSTLFRVMASHAGVVTVGPFTAGSETAPAISFNVASEMSSSTEPDDVLLARLKREGHVPLVIRVDVVPATPVEGQIYNVTWRAVADSAVPHLEMHGLEEAHWSADEIKPSWNPPSGIGRYELYRANLIAPRGEQTTIPETTFSGYVNDRDGSSRVVRRIMPPLTITIAPPPVAEVPVGEFELTAGSALPVGEANDIPSSWHTVAVVAKGTGKLDTAAAPELAVPAGVAYTVRSTPELTIIHGARPGFVRQWTYDIHSNDPLRLQFRFHTYNPFTQMKRDVVASAALPQRAPPRRRGVESFGLIPTIIFDAMLGATLVIALAISRRP
ncbi:MAG TPA: hypothetical protein VLV78_23560 [Thermoanaerobaculia bacterium]|nr:hypothetical protein [Thermoanaerobaculia bacterium]